MSRRVDYIPRTDGDFNVWQANFVTEVVANPAAYGLTPADVVDVAAHSTAWQASLAAKIVAQNDSKAAVENNNEDRDVLESDVRSLTKRIQARKATTDAQREKLGITVPDRTRTSLSEQIVLTEPPPVIKARCTESKTVRIDWYPSQAEGQSEALPQGIDGIGIWVADLPSGTLAQAGGEIPIDECQWRFLALDTNSPYIHNVGNDASVTLAYKAQWFDRLKRMGPFCGPVVVAVSP